MIIIGLTGCIASGKSTVAEIFKVMGCAVFDADLEAKKLYFDEDIANKVSALIGKNILTNGIPDYKIISEYAFFSSENNKKLTDILYPQLSKRFDAWKDAQKEEILILEAAMLLESAFDIYTDIVVNVSANENVRIERIKSRNIDNPQSYINRNIFQWSDDKKNALADYVIINDNKQALLPQVNSLIDKILNNNLDRVVGENIIKNNIICDKSEYQPSKDFIYEVIRVLDTKPIFPFEHYQRLIASNNNKSFSFDYNKFIENIHSLTKINSITNCNIKIVCDGKNEYFFFIKSHYPSKEDYRNGANVVLAFAERTNPNLKKLNVNFRIKTNLIIEKHNSFEALLVNEDGNITEGSRSNVFFIKNNEIFTAPDALVLKGVTRSKVIDVIEKMNLKINYTPLNYKEIELCDGAFLTGTSIDVFNIRSINNISFHKCDELISEILTKFRELYS